MYLGIDLGTSSIKLLLLDEAQRVVATADAALALQRPQPQWSEQNPGDWWASLDWAMRELRAKEPSALSAVKAIGLSGQMHGAVLLGADDELLRPAILWNDLRSASECIELERRVPLSRRITGNLAMPGFTAPKLLWLRKNEPETFARVRTVLLPKDWLRLELSGERVSDMSDASGTLWLDVSQRRWSEQMLAACGLDLSFMPRLVEGSEPAGALRKEWADAWGLKPGIPIAGGGGDNAASAIGIAAVDAGQGFVSLGTSGVVFEVSDVFRSAPERAVHAFAHAVPDRWHQMAVMLSAASALSWACRVTGTSDAALAAAVATLGLAQRASAPLFLPYLSGERTPHNDAQASGVLVGLRHEHGALDVGYAVMEGVAFGLADGLAAMHGGALPLQGLPLALVGGGARSDFWSQLVATALGRVLERHDGSAAAAALGAARLGWMACGASVSDVAQARVATHRFEPQANEAAMLAPRYLRYRALYPALRGHFTPTAA